jgi:hypothetical protein
MTNSSSAIRSGLVLIALYFISSCSYRDTNTYDLWSNNNTPHVEGVTNLTAAQIKVLRTDNPGSEFYMDTESRKYLEWKSHLITKGFVYRSLVTPFTVALDGVELTLYGALYVVLTDPEGFIPNK